MRTQQLSGTRQFPSSLQHWPADPPTRECVPSPQSRTPGNYNSQRTPELMRGHSKGGPPRALTGGVVPGARGEQEEDCSCRLVARRRAALTSRIAEQKRLCRTRWRACSFCGGSSPLRWSRSRSSTARDTSVGRGRARRHSQRHQRRREAPRDAARDRVRASKGERRQTRGRTAEYRPDTRRVAGGKGENAAGRAPCIPRIPIHTQARLWSSGRPLPGPFVYGPSHTHRPPDLRRHATPTPAGSARPPPGPCGDRGGDRGPRRRPRPGGQGRLTRLPRSSPSGSTSAAMSAPTPQAARPPGRWRGGRGCVRPRPRQRATPAEARPRLRSAPRAAAASSAATPTWLLCPQPPLVCPICDPSYCSLCLHLLPALSCPPHVCPLTPFFLCSLDKCMLCKTMDTMVSRADKPTALTELRLGWRGSRQRTATVISIGSREMI